MCRLESPALGAVGQMIQMPTGQHCRGLIAGYKMPRRVEFVDALPMSGAGKVLKRDLRSRFWSEQDFAGDITDRPDDS
jgi:non-ribosomal peptide synthetase component E (peptide arylation enzyme)